MALSLPSYQFTKMDLAQRDAQEAGGGVRDSRGYSLTTRDVAILSGLKPVTIRRYAKGGYIRSAKCGGQYRFRGVDVDEWMDVCCVHPSGSASVETRSPQLRPAATAATAATGRSMSDLLALHASGGAR